MARWVSWLLVAVAVGATALLALLFRSDDSDGGLGGEGETPSEETWQEPRLAGTGEATREVARDGTAHDLTIRGRVLDAEGNAQGDLPVGLWLVTPETTNPRDPARWGDRPEEAFRRSVERLEAEPAPRPAPEETLRSAADGSFSFRVRRAGSYEIAAQVDGPLASTRPSAHVSARNPTADVTVSVTAGTALRGRVVDLSGRGLAAEVSGSCRKEERTAWSAGPVPTGAEGAFVLEPLVAGPWTLSVRVPGRLTLRGVRVSVPREEPLEIRIGGEGSALLGRVTDPAGRPVAGATLMVTVMVDGDSGLLATLRAVTGSEGTYRVDEAPLGTVGEVTAHAAGFAVHRSAPPIAPWTGATIVARRETRLDVTLEPGAVVEGHVLEAGTGRGVADVDVFVAVGGDRRGPPLRPFAGRSGPDGAYRIEGVPPGKAVLLAQGPRHLLRAVSESRGQGPRAMELGPDGPMAREGAPPELVLVIAPEGGTYRRDLTVVPGLAVRGVVLSPGGEPVEGAEITLRSGGLTTAARNWDVAWPGGTETLGSTDVDGRFEASPLPGAGSATLLARKAPFVPGVSEPVLLGAGAPPADVTIRLGSGATLEGRVLAPDGSPVASASVNAWGSWMAPPTGSTYGSTDAAGAFRFEGIPAGDVTIQVTTPRYRATPLVVTDVKPGEVRSGLEVRLEEGVRVAGVLVDGEDRPIPGRGIMLWAETVGPASRLRATTGPDGTFEFLAAPRGRVNLQVEMTGPFDSLLSLMGNQVEAPADGVRLVADARPLRVIEGTVTDAAGVPVPLFQLNVTGTHRGTGFEGVGYTSFGASSEEGVNGRFRRAVSGDPPYHVKVSRARDAAGRPLNLRSREVQVEDPSRPVEIRLTEGLEITGHVLGPDRRGVPGAAVSGGGQVAGTDAEGAFTLSGLETGDVRLSCRVPAGFVPTAPITVAAGTDGVRFDLRAGLPVAGTVLRADGRPAPQGNVTATWPAAGDSPAGGLNAPLEGGRFRIEGIPEGAPVTLAIRVYDASRARQSAPLTRQTVAGTTDLLIQVEEGASLSGLVVDADGKPFVNAWILVTPEAAGPAPSPHYLSLQPDGTFRVDGLARGVHRVDVQRHDGGPVPEPLRVTPPAEGLRLALPRGERISGRLVGEGDLRGFFVQARSEGVRNARFANAMVNSDGSFTLEGVSAGPQVVMARSEGDDRYAVETGVRAGSTGVRLDLRKGLRIEGRVEAEGAPGPFWIQVEGEAWDAFAQTGTDGSFVVRGMPPGAYRVSAHSNEGKGAREENVAAGTSGLRLRIPR